MERERYLLEKYLEEKLLQRCGTIVGHYGVTQCGQRNVADFDQLKPYVIQHNGETLYFTAQEAWEYLENLIQNQE